jgi:fructoselysine 6-kinase
MNDMDKDVERNIAFIGDLTVDIYPGLGKIHLGGASLNGAVWAKRAGTKNVSVIAAVGTDEYGGKFNKMMMKKHINTEGVSVLPGATSSIDIIMESRGDHRWGDWNAGVLANYHLGKREYTFLQKHVAVSLTIYGKTRHLLSEFTCGWRRAGDTPFLVVNFDDLSQFSRSIASVEKSLKSIDAGFFGLDLEKDEELLKQLKVLSQQTNKLIIVTLGKYGAQAWRGIEEYVSPGCAVSRVVDTTGAGDAFLAGFLTEYIQSHSIQSGLDAGNKIAAQKIQKFGAF